MTKEKPSNNESGIDNEGELPSSLKDNHLSLEKMLKEMNQAEKVEEVLNLYGLSSKNAKESDGESDDLYQVNQIDYQAPEIDFRPQSNDAINPKRDRIVKRWTYLTVFIFGSFLIIAVIGAYIDFYKFYTQHDADYIALQALEQETKTDFNPNQDAISQPEY